MAVFVPVAVLASGFFASSVSAAAIPAALPIIDPSYVNNGLTEEKVASILNSLNNLDEEKLAKLPSFLTNGKFWEGALTTVGAAAGGIGAWLGVTGGKRSIEDLSDDDKMAALGALLAQSGALNDLDGEKLAKLPGFLTNGKFWEGALTTVGAAAGGIGAWLGVTGGKRSINDLSDDDKMAALGALMAQSGALDNLDGEKLAKLPSFLTNGKFWEGALTTVGAAAGGIGAWLGATGGKRSINDLSDDDKMAALGALMAQSGALDNLDGEKLAKLPSFLTNGKFWEGALTTVGAAAGGIGAWLGATGGKRSIEELNDEDKEAALKHLVPAIVSAVGGLLGLGAGAYQHHQNGQQKRSIDDLNDEDKEAALKHLIPAIATAVSGFLGLGAGAYQHHQNGQPKRSIDELNDEDKEAALKHLVPAIVSAVGGLLGLGAGAYQHHQNGQKRSVDELSDEDKEAAFRHLIPAIAGAVSGFLGLGAGAYQHHKNGQQKRSINPEELSALFGSGKRSEDSALLARMLDSEFY